MGEILDFEKFKKEKEVDIARQEEDKKIIERLEQREKERVSADIKISSISGADLLRLKSFLKELEGVDYEIKDLKLIENDDEK